LELAKPILASALAWWLSTGAILWLIRMPRSSHKWTAAGATMVLALATFWLLHLRDRTGEAAAYQGFFAGLALWAWHEVMFLTGLITGPERRPCPGGLQGWQRFRASVRAVWHHEVGIAVHAAIIVLLSWGAANQFAAWTFLLLWAMRLSSKFVIYSGAPNAAAGFLPRHLDYLKSYFSLKRPGAVFIAAIASVTSLAVWLAWTGLGQPTGSFGYAGFLLLATMGTLAVIEHWALVLPVPDPSLWEWTRRGAEKSKRNGPNGGVNHGL
jgi:putative photosynthetic complex assembly protein 2